MRSSFYPKMAASNVRKNAKLYVPYILTCICTIALFFIMDCIANNQGLDELQGSDSLKIMLRFGEVIVGIFAVVFLFYTNSFLIKRRKKELGLYSILGLEKRHIGRILFFECLYTSAISIMIGLFIGVLFSKLMFMVILKMIQTNAPFAYVFNWKSIQVTFILFGITFVLTLIYNLLATNKVNPIDLLYGGNKGEKEPKSKWLLALIGLILLGIGYYMAITVQSPVDAMLQLFFAIVLVMAGTYLLFITGSVAFLKLLRKNKNFYYQPKHFTTVSGMIYRMKQNAVGLANISILSTGVLLSIATTVSLNIGMNGLLDSIFPKDVMVTAYDASEDMLKQMETLSTKVADECQVQIKEKTQYRSMEIATYREGNEIKLDHQDSLTQMSGQSMLMSLDDYRQIEPGAEKLADDEVYVGGFITQFEEPTLVIGDNEFKVKKNIESDTVQELNARMIVEGYVIVFSNMEIANEFYNLTNENSRGSKSTEIQLNLTGSEENIATFYKTLRTSYHELLSQEKDLMITLSSKQIDSIDFRAMTSGFLFLGVFLGILFLSATVLIIYYKQISEGYDDKERFEIMQKVGMSKQEVKKTIRSQVLMVFFLPLAVAIIHVAAAFNLMSKLLLLFGLTNTGLFMVGTIGTICVFAIIYSIVFLLTARTYYKIVG